MKNIIIDVDQLVNFAQQFRDLTGYDKFIPCYVDKQTNKKPPCIKDYTTRSVQADGLKAFTTMQCIGLALRDNYVALDQDGLGAVQYLLALELRLGTLPATLSPSSAPGTRQAFIFELPDNWKGKLKFSTIACADGSKLEIQTDKKYQIICGAHPSAGQYTQLSNVIKPAVLPEEYCQHFYDVYTNATLNAQTEHPRTAQKVTFANIGGDTSEELDLAWAIFQFLHLIDHPIADLEDRNNRVRLAGIAKSIDDGDAGRSLAWRIWQLHPSFDEQKSWECWEGLSAGGASRATIGTLKYYFALAFSGAEKDTSKAQLVEEYRDIYQSIIRNTNSRLSLDEYCTVLYDRLQVDPNVNIEAEHRNYCFLYRHIYTELANYWEKYLKDRAVDREKQLAALSSIEPKKIADAAAILKMIPGGEVILDKLESKSIDPFKGLLVYLCCAISTRKKERKAIVMDDRPVASNLMVILNAPTSANKSLLIDMFSEPLITLDTLNREEDDRLHDQYEDHEALWNATSPKDRLNLSFPVEFGGTGYGAEFNVVAAFDPEKAEMQTSPQAPKKPKPAKRLPELITDELTPEYIMELNANQDVGSLWLSHELLTIFQSIKGYGANKVDKAGSFAQLIKIWDGKAFKTGRVTKRNIHGTYGTSILTAIQPKALEAFTTLDDEQGFIGRAIFIDGKGLYFEPSDPNFVIEKAGQLQDILVDQYRKLAQLPTGTMKPTSRGYGIWKAFKKRLEKKIEDYPTMKLGYQYSLLKLAENVARIAGILQDLVAIDAAEPSTVISDAVMRAAVAIGEQIELDHAVMFGAYQVDEEVDTELLEHQAYVLNYLVKRGKPATLHQLCKLRYFSDKKMNSASVKPVLDSLIGSKLDFIPGDGYRLR